MSRTENQRLLGALPPRLNLESGLRPVCSKGSWAGSDFELKPCETGEFRQSFALGDVKPHQPHVTRHPPRPWCGARGGTPKWLLATSTEPEPTGPRGLAAALGSAPGRDPGLGSTSPPQAQAGDCRKHKTRESHLQPHCPPIGKDWELKIRHPGGGGGDLCHRRAFVSHSARGDSGLAGPACQLLAGL